MEDADNSSTYIESTVVELEDWMNISDANYDMELLESTVIDSTMFDSTLDPNSEQLRKKKSSIQSVSNQYGIDWKNSFQDEGLIICPFVWNEGGEEVYLVASFSAEPRRFKMYKNGNKFYVILEIQRGIYPYRFIIDGVDCYASDHPNFTIKNGLVVNIIDIRYYVPMEYTMHQGCLWASDLPYSQKLPKETYFSLHPPPIPDLFNYSPIGENIGCISNDIHVYGNNLCQDNKAAQLLGSRYRCYGIIVREKQECAGGIKHRQLYTEYLYVTVAQECKTKEIDGDEYASRWKEMLLKSTRNSD